MAAHEIVSGVFATKAIDSGTVLLVGEDVHLCFYDMDGISRLKIILTREEAREVARQVLALGAPAFEREIAERIISEAGGVDADPA